ncbi:leucine-rich repeat and immunoglobulin-like domain-containing nogo receptor-interacting protein 1-B [Mizuhopecten yessoensis]|uniref:leucine-rich repeat and immunoglobulin-like domain-containing nogo receptor-interacting protein 1-B n=1 Tax=Mizuhopecten yessoensis TaxID=6573 RepID=UPI000B45D0E7|nr:leucine-rich repeat and immunoglobulin-like domain-containing nogo receptor-interacting protein 1-B [Mizuhopecten yessoensis]
MDNHVIMFVLCVLWILPYSAAFTADCCHVTWTAEARNVSCSGCGLQDVPKDLPINTTELNLRNNSLSILLRESFFNLVSLKSLNLSMNKLFLISPGAFDDLGNLEYLDLSDNNLNLSSFATSTFRILNSLKCLNIQRNTLHLLKSYPEDALSYLSQLESLTIDIFEGFNFGNGFLKTNLNTLEINFIGKEWVSLRNSSFQGLRNSNISYLNINAPIRKLETDYLSPFSKLTSFSLISRRTMPIKGVLRALYGLRERTLESLSLIANGMLYDGMQHLVKADLLYLGTICVRELDLTNNSIGSITMEAIISWTKRTCLEVLNLSKNQFYTAQMITLLNLFPVITYADFSYMRYMRIRKRTIPFTKQVLFLPRHL